MLFSFIRPLGYFLENVTVLNVGQAYIISPLPLPFSDIGPYENYTQGRIYKVSFSNGDVKQFTESRELNKKIKGIHRYVVAVAFPLEVGHTLPDVVRQPIYNHIFCQSQLFDRTDVSRVHIYQWDKRTGYQTEAITYICQTS